MSLIPHLPAIGDRFLLDMYADGQPDGVVYTHREVWFTHRPNLRLGWGAGGSATYIPYEVWCKWVEAGRVQRLP